MRPVTVSVMEPEEVTRLARRAIAVLAAHGPGRSDGMARRLIQMSDAFIASDETQRHEVLLRLRQDGVSNEDLATLGKDMKRLIKDRRVMRGAGAASAFAGAAASSA